MIHLVESLTLPAQKGRLLKAKVASPIGDCPDLLYEPDDDLLVPLAISAAESLVAACEDKEVWVPVENSQGVKIRLGAGTCLGTVGPAQKVQEVVPYGSYRFLRTCLPAQMLHSRWWNAHLSISNSC